MFLTAIEVAMDRLNASMVRDGKAGNEYKVSPDYEGSFLKLY